jgi:hypothetical protein
MGHHRLREADAMKPLYWLIIDRQLGEEIMICDTRDEARSWIRGMSSFEVCIAKVVPCR